MDIPTDVHIVCPDGNYGYLDGVVINPVTDEITHIVTTDDKLLGEKRLVPLEEIAESTFRYILLRCTLQELAAFDLFTDIEYIPARGFDEFASTDLEDRTTFSWPFASTKSGYIPIEHEHIPANELMFHHNTEIFATDGKVGFLDDLIIDPDTHKITDLAVRIGYFWGYKDVDIPLKQIESLKQDSIYLKLNKATVESLPVITNHEDR